MALSVHQLLHRQDGTVVRSTATGDRHTGRIALAVALAATFLALLVDAMLRPMAFFDLRIAQEVQRIDQSAINGVLNAIRTLTGSEGAIVAWVVVGLVFLARRWWAPAVALALLPVGGIINEGIGILLVERGRPHHDLLFRTSHNFEERSFPSGHVTGAVLLYGLIFFAAGRIAFAPARWLVRAVAVAIPAASGYQRIWGGAHWPTDVLAAYALGGLLLLGLIALADRLEPELAGLTLVGAVSRTVILTGLVLVGVWQALRAITRRHGLVSTGVSAAGVSAVGGSTAIQISSPAVPPTSADGSAGAPPELVAAATVAPDADAVPVAVDR